MLHFPQNLTQNKKHSYHITYHVTPKSFEQFLQSWRPLKLLSNKVCLAVCLCLYWTWLSCFYMVNLPDMPNWSFVTIILLLYCWDDKHVSCQLNTGFFFMKIQPAKAFNTFSLYSVSIIFLATEGCFDFWSEFEPKHSRTDQKTQSFNELL